MTKLKIDLKEGILEVEGEEGFVATVYTDFKTQLANTLSRKHTDGRPSTGTLPNGAAQKTSEMAGKQKSSSKAKSAGSKAMPSIVKDLDLTSRADRPSLRDFYEAKAPATAMERNVVFVYHLKSNLEMSGITLDHVYTCYKDAGVKPPNALRQSLIDTANRKGWIDTSTLDDIKLSLRGESFVEHDLPAKPKE